MADFQGKRFTRSSADRKVAGVCGGIGAYLNIDPVVFRIIFLVALVCFGSGLLIYLIMWLCLPQDNPMPKP